MTPADRRKRVELLLPLAVGLTITVLAWALPSAFASVAGLVGLLALGAAIPGRSWQTGALASLPSVIVSLVAAAGESLGTVAVTVALSPLMVGIAALVVKGGSLLAERAGVGEAGEQVTEGRWKPFETKTQRGRFLVVVAVLVVVAGGIVSKCSNEAADRAATRRADEIRVALDGRSPESLRSLINTSSPLPGGPYRFATMIDDSFEATAAVDKGLESRCILVSLGADRRASTQISHKRC